MSRSVSPAAPAVASHPKAGMTPGWGAHAQPTGSRIGGELPHPAWRSATPPAQKMWQTGKLGLVQSWVTVRRLPVIHFLLFGKPNSAVSLQIPPNFLRAPETAKRFETAEKVPPWPGITPDVGLARSQLHNMLCHRAAKNDFFSGLKSLGGLWRSKEIWRNLQRNR